MKECKIASLKLKLGKREVTLSLEEAKSLKESLDELFGKEVIREYHNGWWYWQQPLTYTLKSTEPYCATTTTWATTSGYMDTTTNTLCLST